ncbi:MAG: hypothetical protein JJU40_11445, partial [Rhodobacteraceae bacterium]|nr:hypothetical protein [Paracoccaceae bacterium]
MAAPPPATPSPPLARRSRSALAAGLATLVWLGAAVSPEAQTRVVWHGTEMARVDVLSGWRGADDRHVAALKITLAPGWKTYWRAPGDAGIPPTLTDSGSRNLARAWLEFPRPSVFEAGGMHIVGYEQQVILPLIVEPRRRGRDIALSMQLQFGICEDVCIPITARVSGQLSAGQETRDPVIVAALASRPMSAEQAGVGSVRCTLEPGPGAGARLVAMLELPHLGGGEFVVFEPGNRRRGVGAALARR